MKTLYQQKRSSTSQSQRPKQTQNLSFLPSSIDQTWDIFQSQKPVTTENQSMKRYQELVAKAKNRIEHKQQLPLIQYNLKKPDGKSTFMTDLRLKYQDEYKVDDDQIQIDDKVVFDDLGELRRMIKRTKRAVSTCGKDLQHLKTGLSTLNKNAQQLGFGIDEDRIEKLKLKGLGKKKY